MYAFLLTGTPKGSAYLLFKRKLQKYSLWSLDAYHACVYIIQIYNLVGIALKYQIILQGAAASIHNTSLLSISEFVLNLIGTIVKHFKIWHNLYMYT